MAREMSWMFKKWPFFARPTGDQPDVPLTVDAARRKSRLIATIQFVQTALMIVEPILVLTGELQQSFGSGQRGTQAFIHELRGGDLQLSQCVCMHCDLFDKCLQFFSGQRFSPCG